MSNIIKIVIIGLFPYDYFKENGINKFHPESHPATWMSNLLSAFSSEFGAQLFYITTSKDIIKPCKYELNGITFYILPRGIPLLKKGYPMWFKLDAFTNYIVLRNRIKKIIDIIKPDIINSHGTEYAYSLALNDLKYSSVVTIQGIVNFWKDHNKSSYVRKQARLENRIFKKQNNYIIPDIPSVRSYILSQNPKAVFFHAWYPVDLLSFHIPEQSIDADIVFASRISKEKGIFDITQAVSIIKRKHPEIKLKIIGIQNSETDNLIRSQIKELKLNENINFIGFIPDKEKFYKEIKKSKILVVPSHFDVAPLVIRESMALGVPVVAYETDGIPMLLEYGKCGILVEKYNIDTLASKISDLLNDKNEYQRLKLEATIKSKEFTPQACFNNFINCYKYLIDVHNESKTY